MDERHRALIVTGAHLIAERDDRPAAYRLRDAMLEAMGPGDAGRVLVCSDLWYLNQPELRHDPTVSIGAPGVNALTAFLAGRLPTALAVAGRITVQLDPELADPVAACWGVGPAGTAQAVAAFAERYLPAFVEAAAR
ncbi:MAG: hypothetical protein IT437_06630 [Phycisphaerales bacterium]|nr:hypothetical protein [Phycisphaerales bacterium]